MGVSNSKDFLEVFPSVYKYNRVRQTYRLMFILAYKIEYYYAHNQKSFFNFIESNFTIGFMLHHYTRKGIIYHFYAFRYWKRFTIRFIEMSQWYFHEWNIVLNEYFKLWIWIHNGKWFQIDNNFLKWTFIHFFQSINWILSSETFSRFSKTHNRTYSMVNLYTQPHGKLLSKSVSRLQSYFTTKF